MKTSLKLIPLTVAASMLAAAFPVAAALSGAVRSIQLSDWNRNGKIDRVVIAVENPSSTSWSVRNSSGLKVAMNNVDIKLKAVFIASAPTADPVLIEVMLDETDANLAKTTSVADFEVTYAPTSDLSGISDGAHELQLINTGDEGLSANTEQDLASPMLLSATPTSGAYRVNRSANIVLTFSEPMSEGSLMVDSMVKPGDWIISWSSDRKTATLVHTPYDSGDRETLTVTAQDIAGNALVTSSFPNPFSFRATTDDGASPLVESQFLLNAPANLATLQAGTPTIVSWYSNQPEIDKIRLSYSIDAGTTYNMIGAFAPADNAIWYPPAVSGAAILKAEAVTSAGLPINVAFASLTLATPAQKPVLSVVAAPAVSDTSDTAAKIALKTDAPPKTIQLTCDSPVADASLNIVTGRPTDISFSLTGLQKNAKYVCVVKLTDTFGVVSETSVPVFTASTAGDLTPPVLISASVDQFNPPLKSARLSWTTDEPSSFEVSYGKLLDFGGKIEGKALNTTHAVTLVNLQPGQMHQARITMLDAKGNASISKDIQFVFLADGTLIKGEKTSAVYWYVGGKRYVFPHENIYKSWFKDFSKVVTIPDGQLAGIPLGGNIQMRAGTNLLKIQSDPKVYVVENGGKLRGIASEAQARVLFGTDWAKRVRDIDVGFFTGYRILAELADGEFPDGYLARTSNGKVWLISGNSIRSELTPDAMTLNEVDASMASAVNESGVAWDRLTVGTAVANRDTRLHVIWGNDKGESAVAP